jgi:hypothetical protein
LKGPESDEDEVSCQSDKGGQVTSGGGFSSYYSTPSFQANYVSTYLTGICTQKPTTKPTETPSQTPTAQPTTAKPSETPSELPTFSPSYEPTVSPTAAPTVETAAPTVETITTEVFGRFEEERRILRTSRFHATAYGCSSQFNSTGRGYPDVSLMAFNYTYISGGEVKSGSGYQAAAVFTGMLSLINSRRLSSGYTGLGWINPALYKYSYDSSLSIFNDIESGTNECTYSSSGDPVCCSQFFSAQSGWDAVTGLGSVNFTALLSTLGTQRNVSTATQSPSVKPSAIPTISPSGPSVRPTFAPSTRNPTTSEPTYQNADVVTFVSQVSYEGLPLNLTDTQKSILEEAQESAMGISCCVSVVDTSYSPFPIVDDSLSSGTLRRLSSETSGIDMNGRVKMKLMANPIVYVKTEASISLAGLDSSVDSTEYYQSIKAQFYSAVTAGNYTNLIVALAQELNETSLVSITVNNATVGSLVVILPPTFSPTRAPTITTGEIAGAVIGAIIGVAILAIALYYAILYIRYRQTSDGIDSGKSFSDLRVVVNDEGYDDSEYASPNSNASGFSNNPVATDLVQHNHQESRI